MKKLPVGFLIVLLTVVFLLSDIQETNTFDPQRTFSPESLKSDLGILWDVLDEGHAGLDRYTPRNRLKQSFDGVMAGLTAPEEELDFYLKILPLIEEIKDGHTRAQLSPAAEAFLNTQPVIFPFELRFLDRRAYIFRNLSGDLEVRSGAELLEINGMPLDRVLQELLRLIPNDAGILSRKIRQLQNPQTFGRLFAIRFGRQESFRIRFRPHSEVATREVSVPGIRGTDIMKILYERYPDTAARPPLYELSWQGTTAVLTIRAFADGPEKELPRYPVFLKDSFQTLVEKGTENLIIDLRENGGGDDHYGKLLFAYFADEPFQYYRALETKKDHFDLFQYTTISKDAVAAATKRVKPNSRGWFDVQGHPNVGTQQPQSPRFAGKVAILIGGLSFSATGETTSLFHYHKKAVFFGEECGAGYYGNTSGFMVMVTLPNTGIQVRVPLVLYTMAVDGYPADRGIVPDFPVGPTIEDLLAGRDPVLEKALAYFAAK